jgi:hypothetical protein
MLGKVLVVNVKGLSPNDRSVVYIGRDFAGWQGSVLGNPYKHGSRDEIIRRYKGWLWAEYQQGGDVASEINRLVELVRRGKHIKLGCWCKPLACHGDVVKALIEYLLTL